jgi:membrane-bound lytic murein transglycosylase B
MKKLWQKYIVALLLIFLVFPALTTAQSDADTRQQLEKELQAIENQITELEQQLTTTKGEKKTLANKIKQLKNEQTRLRLQIKATNIKLGDLDKKISTTVKAIDTNKAKIIRLKIDLSKLLRLLHQKDQELFLLRLLIDGGLNEAFAEAANYEKLSTSIGALVQESKMTQQELNTKQTAYEEQQDDSRELLALANIQQNTLNGKLQEQTQLLNDTRGLETTYQNLLKDSKKQAAEIRSRIYELLGVSAQINFGQAVTLAQATDKQTGVPAAFLLAILTQESNLGKNVGTCNRPGDPPEKSWKVIMKPTRDQEPFITITSELGRDPDITPVSCPMKNKNGSQLGWGGAMGPAQFIPSTWIGYKDKVSALTGRLGRPADPWDIRDAFMAAGLLLKNNGADETKDGQWKAAMRYFSGGTNKKYRFYGDNVLTLTAKYEQDIKDLGN